MNLELIDAYSDSEKRFLLQYIEKERPIIPLDKIIARLNHFEPIDYILGYTYFFGLKIKVNEYTLIPRPETEELVELIIDENKEKPNLKVLDIGTGSGCIAVALAKNLSQSQISAIDVSTQSLKMAELNSSENNILLDCIRMNILNEDEWSQLGKYDIIVSNPPYIKLSEKAELSKSVSQFEPSIALFVEDEDPLLFYKMILKFSISHLNEDGIIYFETHQDYQLEECKGFKIDSIRDMSGNPRFLKCKKLKLSSE